MPKQHNLIGGERGFIAYLMAIGLVVILSIVALVIDVGIRFFEQRRLQVAVDASSFAAITLLGTSPTNAAVAQEARSLAFSNGVKSSEIGNIECGSWNTANRSFSPCGSSVGGVLTCSLCSDSKVNAVRVTAHKQVLTRFARLVGIRWLAADVLSVAFRKALGETACEKPFGIEAQSILDPNNPTPLGSTFTVGTNSPGNWGKLDLDGINMSSGTNFRNAMQSCATYNTAVGDVVSSGTGNGGPIATAFQPLIGKEMLFFATSDFGNGNKPVTIVEPIRVRFEGQQSSGNKWTATFTLLERNATAIVPPTNPPTDRVLVQ